MANTFKFGNGNWAVKDGSALAYNDENNNFKPLPFVFTRASSATRVNKQGLIETVPSGKPRIDFLNNTSGHLLLEPSRANYSIYSEDTSTWTYTEFGSGSAGTITTGKTDMFGGTNAMQVDFPSNAENVSVRFGHTSSSISSGTVSLTLYIKLVSSGSKNLQLRASTSDIINVNSTEFVRYEVSGTKSSSEALQLKLRPSDGTSSGGFSIIVCHPQEEVGSYPTSYIPTEGSGVTRVAETCNGAGNSTVFNDSEGVLYVETSMLSSSQNNSTFQIDDGTSTNRVRVRFANTTNQINGLLYSGTSGPPNINYTANDVTNPNKVALRYQVGQIDLFVNGSKVGTSTGNATPTGFNNLQLGIEGKVKDVKVYNTTLTDTELQNLTS